MSYVWLDYSHADAPTVEAFLDDAARRMTGCEDGWEDYYTYWENHPDTHMGENFWAKVISLDDTPLAVMALFLHDGVLSVSEYIVAPDLRGKGHGSAILRDLLANSQEVIGAKINCARAVIFPGNEASIRAFEKAGFHFASAHPDGDALCYVYEPFCGSDLNIS